MSWLRRLFTIREQSEGDVAKPFLEHLEELRMTILKMLVALSCGTIIAYCFRKTLVGLAEAPLLAAGGHLVTFEITEGFMMSLKLAVYAGIVIAFPALLWFVIGFILPALTRQEKKMLIPGIFAGTLLFAGGVILAYEFVLPKAIKFFFDYNKQMGLEPSQLTVGKYFSFVSNLCLACGLLCEVPVVILALAKLGFINYQLLARTRSYAVVGVLIVVAIIAPTPDPFTFMTLSVPALAIYELCIWIVWLMERESRKKDERDRNDPK